MHSMKDVPTTLAPGTALPCTLARQPTNDVFISSKYRSLAEVPGGAVLGTSSLRRKAQLLAMNPALKVVMFRGNVQTRLRKIDSGAYDALWSKVEGGHTAVVLLLVLLLSSYVRDMHLHSAVLS